jgi:pyruvate carboxylase
MLGDIVKVTPTSKVVGDMALFMVSNNLTTADVMDPNRQLAFPESFVELLEGKLGQPHGGWPVELQKIVLRGKKASKERPGAILPKTDFDAILKELESKVHHAPSETDLMSYLMYPKVFVDFDSYRKKFGDLSLVPTAAFFFGMKSGQELDIALEPGKTIVLKFLTLGEPDVDGMREVFYELNGQPRSVRIADRSLKASGHVHVKANLDDPTHIAAPMPGKIGVIVVKTGQTIQKGEKLLSIEAMKMETAVYAPFTGTIKEIHVQTGSTVQSRDLLMVVTPVK